MKVEIVSDVSKVVADAGTLADRYNEVSDELKDLAKAGDAAGKKIEDAFEDGAKEAGKLEGKLDEAGDAAKQLARKADDAFDKLGQSSKKAGDDVERNIKQGTDGAGEGLDNFKDEANSTAKESAASFDGSAESIIGSFQEVAANAFGGFGPAGAAAGLAMAAGIGIAITKMQEGAEAATEFQQRAVDLAGKIQDAGGDIRDLELGEIIADWGREVMEDNWITAWVDESTTRFQEAAKDAKEAGVDYRDAIKAAAGSADDSRKFLDGTAEAWQKLTDEIDRGTSTTEGGLMVFDDSAKAALKQRNALSDLRGQAEENIKTTAEAIEITEIENGVLGESEEANKAAADAIKDRADASDAAADAAMGVVGAENDWIETLKQMNEDIKSNGKNLNSNTEAGRANKESLVDLAGAANGFRDAQIAAGEPVANVTQLVQGQRDAFIRAAEAAGYNGTEAAALADKYGLIPGNVETLVKANGTEEAKAAIESIPAAASTDVAVTETGAAEVQAKVDGIAGKEAAVTVTDDGTADAVQSRVEAVKGKEVKIDVDDEYTVSEVQKRIDGIRGKDVPITVSISNYAQLQSSLDRLTAPRSVWVTVNERAGVSAP